MVNPETGEPLLQVGIAYKALRDKMKKEEIEPTKEKKVSETELKNKKRTDTEKNQVKSSLIQRLNTHNSKNSACL